MNREVQLLKMMANKHRHAIAATFLRFPVGHELCVGELLAEVPIEQPLMSLHLSQLKKVGILKSSRQSRKIFYSLVSYEKVHEFMTATFYLAK